MSQRSAGVCTRCTCSNAFPAESLKKITECVRTGAAGARTRRFLGHHLLHPLILRLLVLCAPADFEAQRSLLYNRLHLQIKIPNACPEIECCLLVKKHKT